LESAISAKRFRMILPYGFTWSSYKLHTALLTSTGPMISISMPCRQQGVAGVSLPFNKQPTTVGTVAIAVCMFGTGACTGVTQAMFCCGIKNMVFNKLREYSNPNRLS
jgi:hypothetical protein